MPTPRDSTEELLPQIEPHSNSSCPPEPIDRPAQWSRQVLGDIEHAISDVETSPNYSRPTNLPSDVILEPLEHCEGDSSKRATGETKCADLSHLSAADTPSVTGDDEKPSATPRMALSGSSALNLSFSDRYGITSPRLIQTYTSCKLRSGSKYRGTQTSDSQRYKVEVSIKTVDMSESFICGFLKIEGLTPEHATLTTYFEGEIIGSKYTFQTRNNSWGASEKDDLKHWGHFPAWKPLAKQAKKPDFHYKHTENREHIFMRWKEKFLVPDHRVTEITGASFEGFYYICFNQMTGSISGIYNHSKSDHHQNNKVQNLELQWIPDAGHYASLEFR